MYVPERVIRPQLDVVARASIQTAFGVFNTFVFRWSDGGAGAAHGLSPDHVALVMGEVAGARDLLVRVHSECITGEVFGSLRCDCRQQLEGAQKAVARAGSGAILYLRQEGRGIGLANKIRAYELQMAGHDTVEANRMLGLPDDARDYGAAAAMLEHLGVSSVHLLTNNPHKVKALVEAGIDVTARVPALVTTNPWSAGYLETKRTRMGHVLPEDILAAASDAE